MYIYVWRCADGEFDGRTQLYSDLGRLNSTLDQLSSQQIVKFGDIAAVENNLVLGSFTSGTSLCKVGRIGILSIDFSLRIQQSMQDYVIIATIPQEFASNRFRIISTMPQRSQGAYPVMITLSGTNLKIFSHGLHNDARTSGLFVYTI